MHILEVARMREGCILRDATGSLDRGRSPKLERKFQGRNFPTIVEDSSMSSRGGFWLPGALDPEKIMSFFSHLSTVPL